MPFAIAALVLLAGTPIRAADRIAAADHKVGLDLRQPDLTDIVDSPPNLDGLPASLPANANEAGAFTTHVALQVPPFFGLEPKMGFSYDSNAENGPVGVGWSLSIPSVVQRRGQGNGTPRYDNTDSFFLDGVEVLPCTPTTPSPACRYKASDPSYRYYFPERETYERIAFSTRDGTWHVWRTDGSHLTYGLAWLTEGNRLPNRWLLTAVEDPIGNRVTYEYRACNARPLDSVIDVSVVQQAEANLHGDPASVHELVSQSADTFGAEPPSGPIPRRDSPLTLIEPPDRPGRIAALVSPSRRSAPPSPDENPFYERPGPTPTDPLPAASEVAGAAMARLPSTAGVVPPAVGPADDVASPEEVARRIWDDSAWVNPAIVAHAGPTPSAVDAHWAARAERWLSALTDQFTVEYLYLDKIHYGETTIRVFVEPRPDRVSFGIGDRTVGQMSCRVKAIDVQTADEDGKAQIVRSYQLEYQHRVGSLQSVLHRVRTYGSDAQIGAAGEITNSSTATALPDVTLSSAPDAFVSYDAKRAPAPESSWLSGSTKHPLGTYDMALPQAPTQKPFPGVTHFDLDFNGDGLTDHAIAYFIDVDYPTRDYRILIQPFLARAGGGFEQLSAHDPGIGRQLGPLDRAYSRALVGDTDGDGRQELIWLYDFQEPGEAHKYLDAHVSVTRWDEHSGFVTSPGVTLDWPLEQDWVELVPDPNTGVVNVNSFRDPTQQFVTDVNDDGLDDILLVSGISAQPDDARCAADLTACITEVMRDDTWTLVVALSRGDGTFRRLNPVHTGWPIFPVLLKTSAPMCKDPLLGYDVPCGPGDWNSEVWASFVGATIASRIFRPGESDRFLLADMNGDGRSDLIAVTNRGRKAQDKQRLAICSAIVRGSALEDFEAAPFELRCDEPDLGGPRGLQNRQIFVAGDVDGDRREDLVRIFSWDAQDTKVLYDLDVGFWLKEGAKIGIQPLLSDGRVFVRHQAQLTNERWPRNHEYGIDWRQEYWNVVNYFGGGWQCHDIDGDARCDLTMFKYPYFSQFSDSNTYLNRFHASALGVPPKFGPVFSSEDEPIPEYAADPAVNLLTISPRAFFGTRNLGFEVAEVASVGESKPFFTQTGLAVSDHNGDGRGDVVNWVMRQSGPRAGAVHYDFDVQVALAPATGREEWRMLSADVNGDGVMDLVRAAPSGFPPRTEVNTWIRQPDGFLKQLSIWHGTSAWDPLENRSRNFQVGDFDGDGRHDLARGRYLSATNQLELHVLLARDGGTYQEVISHPTVPDPGAFTDRANWRVLDADGDGRTDLIHLGYVPGGQCPNRRRLRVDTLRSTGDGSFQSRRAEADLCDIPGRSTAFHVGDFDGDGRGDLAGIWQDSQGSITGYTLLADGFGKWRTVRTLIGELRYPHNPRRWMASSLNADRLTDLISLVSAARAGKYDLWLGRLRSSGDGTFGVSESRVASGFDDADVDNWVVADANGDRRSDLVRASFQGNAEVSVDTLLTTSGSKPIRLLWISPPGKASSAALSQSRPVEEMNGTTLLEHIDHDGVRSLVDHVQAIVPRDSIVRVQDALGGTSDVAYASTASLSLSRPGTECALPAGMSYFVTTGIKRDDGRRLASSPSSSSLAYDWQCPRWSTAERVVLGFKFTMEAADAAINRPISRSRRTFELSEACRAQAMVERNEDNNNQWASVATTYVTPGTLPPYHCDRSQLVNGEGASDGSTAYQRRRFAHDEFGKTEWLFDDGDTTAGGDEYTTHTTSSMLQQAFRVVPDLIEVREGDAAGHPLQRSAFCYDGDDPDTGCDHSPSDKGQLSAERVWDDHKNQWYTTRYAHDAWGNVTRVTDPNGHAVETEYDSVHHQFPIITRNALGHAQGTFWDYVHGKPRMQIDTNHVPLTETLYDALGRPKRVTTPDHRMTLYEYVRWGNPDFQAIRVIERAGGGVEIPREDRFDGFGRVWLQQRLSSQPNTHDWREWVYSDSSERPWRVARWRDAGASSGVYEVLEYDYLGRPIRVTHPDTSTRTWMYSARQRVDIDESGHSRRLSFDARGNVKSTTERVTTQNGPPQDIETTFVHDVLGRLRATTDAAHNTTKFDVDSLGRAWHIVDPDRGTLFLDYDPVGNLVSQAHASGRWVAYTYDALDRPSTREGDSGAQSIEWHYDDAGVPFGRGRLTRVLDSASGCAVARSVEYDQMGRVVVDTRCASGGAQTMRFAWDALDRLQEVTYPDGEVVTYGYDRAGRPSAASGYVTSVLYDSEGRQIEVGLANGVTEKHAYDPLRGWLRHDQVLSPKNALYLDLTTDFAPDGLPREATEHAEMAQTDPTLRAVTLNRRFDYDDLHRLLNVQGTATVVWAPGATPTGELANSDLSERFEYDAIGNMTFKSDRGTFGYGHDQAACQQHGACGGGPHAVRSAGTAWYSYDARGNMSRSALGVDTRQMEYDELNKIRRIEISNGTGTQILENAYDGDGARVSKTVVRNGDAPETTRYFGAWLEERPDATLVKRIRVGERLVGLKDGHGVRYLHGDRLGSTRLVTDENGDVETAYGYRAFGARLYGDPRMANGIVFGGHREDFDIDHDGQAALLQMQLRAYDPAIARFLSADVRIPDVPSSQQWNLYGYALNSPFAQVDPSGAQPTDPDDILNIPPDTGPDPEWMTPLDKSLPMGPHFPEHVVVIGQPKEFAEALGAMRYKFVPLNVVVLSFDEVATSGVGAYAQTVQYLGHGGPIGGATIGFGSSEATGTVLGSWMREMFPNARTISLDSCNGGTPDILGHSIAQDAANAYHSNAAGERVEVYGSVANDVAGAQTGGSKSGVVTGYVPGVLRAGLITEGHWGTFRPTTETPTHVSPAPVFPVPIPNFSGLGGRF